MTLLRCVIPLLASALMSACASAPEKVAATAAPTAPAGTPAQKATGDEVVCVKEAPMNSRIPQKVCRTRRAMEKSGEAARETVRDLERGNSRSTFPAGAVPGSR